MERQDNISGARGIIYGVICGLLFYAFVFGTLAWADRPDNRPPDNRPPDRGQEVSSETSSEAHAESRSRADASSESVSTSTSAATGGDSSASATGGAGGEGGVAQATNEGIEVVNEGDSYSSESTNTNVVLVPNNNTSSCLRVYGLSFGNGDGAGALGVPFRDKACDYEQAADDAAAHGQHDIAWWWRCHKKNLYRTFEGSSKEMKHRACWDSMKSMLVEVEPAANFNEPQPEVMLAAAEEFNPETLVAELSDEEIEKLRREIEQQGEEHELVEQRQVQQQNLIESQQQMIERLRREAEALRRAEEERKAAELAAQEKFRQRLKAKEQEK